MHRSIPAAPSSPPGLAPGEFAFLFPLIKDGKFPGAGEQRPNDDHIGLNESILTLMKQIWTHIIVKRVLKVTSVS